MKVLYIVGAIVFAAVAGAGGFFGGMAYAQSQAQNSVADFTRQRAAANQQGGNDPCGFGGRFQFPQGSGQTGNQGGQGGGPSRAQLGNCVARGQIKSVNGNAVEISTADKVVTVQVTDQTVISKTDQGTLTDLKAGERVTVFSRDSGDNPTASTIQLQGIRGPAGQ